MLCVSRQFSRQYKLEPSGSRPWTSDEKSLMLGISYCFREEGLKKKKVEIELGVFIFIWPPSHIFFLHLFMSALISA